MIVLGANEGLFLNASVRDCDLKDPKSLESKTHPLRSFSAPEY
jgi:hypothetical protein